MKLLDCTLRDGGYYNNWDFSFEYIDLYAKTMEIMPVDYLELGYKSFCKQKYGGKLLYSPSFIIERIRNFAPSKKVALMINAKEFDLNSCRSTLISCHELVDMIRIAADPNDLPRIMPLASQIKELGFEVAVNLMYLSDHLELGPVFKVEAM